jgi:hypothetical protein
MSQPIYWCGPLEPNCQISSKPFDGVMYDASTPLGWANICQEVFDRYNCRLGTGLGQKYLLQDDGRWLKVEG